MNPVFKPVLLAATLALLTAPAMAQTPAAPATGMAAPQAMQAATAPATVAPALVVKHYAHLVQATYDDTLASAVLMQKAIDRKSTRLNSSH